ncbi:hypothetical protein B7494_g1401 [Chlorociboria aeruginascens]|nr:hypothetical protein B7494_g1401 [Chlorociboria aeruginascens]
MPSPVGLGKPTETETGGKKPTALVLYSRKHCSDTPHSLHPYTSILTISHLESVVALENAAFSDPQDRATREKLIYRLNKCGELCLGIFATVEPDVDFQAATRATAHLVETGRTNEAVSVLLGHIIATKTTSRITTDESMAYPQDWDSDHPSPSTLGHQESGLTIVLHSIAILPELQGRGLGSVLVNAYIQQMNGTGIADRLALIAHDHKVKWYEKLGFVDKGESAVQFGGGGWYDMVFRLEPAKSRVTYG